MNIYLIGSLKNDSIPEIANELRKEGYEVFDDWFAAGPNADDHWRDYEQGRGRTFVEALNQHYARHTFEFDYRHLANADAVVLVLPAGKSAHLEAGWARGQRKPLFVLLDSPDRWDMMYRFANGVSSNLDGIKILLKHVQAQQTPPQIQEVQDAAPQVQAGSPSAESGDHRGGSRERSESPEPAGRHDRHQRKRRSAHAGEPTLPGPSA